MIAFQRCGRFTLLAALVLLLGTAFLWPRASSSGEPASDALGRPFNHPRLVLIIRHGEKSNDETGIHLNSRGAARAAALPSLFVIPPTFPTKPAPLMTPDFLFAAKPSKHSSRPVETVTPLAKALTDMPIHQQHANDDFQAVVDRIFGDAKHAGKTVLICWHHGNIPELAVAIAQKAKNAGTLKTEIPRRWEGDVFDRVWLFTFDDAGNATFANRPQQLLFGDAKK